MSTSRDLIGRLADVGEEAIAKLADAPGMGRLVETVLGMKDRVDELQRRVLGLEALDNRVAELERRVEELQPGGGASGAPGAAASTATATVKATKPRVASPPPPVADPGEGAAADQPTPSSPSAAPTGDAGQVPGP
jgi:hypothetical protein